jgi:hypothetical protein
VEIELAEAVSAIRDELLEGARRAAGKTLAFTVGPIEMEFTVELKRDAKAKTGFKAWVVTADVEAGTSRASTQKVKLILTPQRPDGRDLLISGRPDHMAADTPTDNPIGR